MGMLTILVLIIMKGTDGLTWNTKMMASVCCQGTNQFLIWNFTEGENERATELQWFFNEKTLVCYVSTSTGFRVADLYEGRVERNGTAGILLKNVCLNDTGEYTLYVKLEEEKERNVQGINLTVVEPPPNECKPIIKQEHPKGIISCSTSCERSPLSIEWIINGTKGTGDIGPYFVVNSSGTSEQPICCLRDFKCLDDYQTKFCMRNNISFPEDMHTVNESVADTNHMVYTSILIILSVILMVLIIVVIVLKRRRIRLFHKCHYTTTKDIEGDQYEQSLSVEIFPMFSKDQESDAVQVSEKPSPIVETDQVMDVDVKLDLRKQVAVEPTHSNTCAQCNEDLQQVPTVAATTDRPLQDSNQWVQIVNNISIDTDFLKSILHSNTALMAELQASRKETRRLERQLYRNTKLRKKENRHKFSFEMTQVKCSDFKNNDTDSSETSEWEDAYSDHTDTLGHRSWNILSQNC